MLTVRLACGKIIAEDFTGSQLDAEVWKVLGDKLQCNLTEKSGILKLFHGNDSIAVVTDEPEDSYVIDIDNTYVPQVSEDVGGITVLKTEEEFLELLEYFDEAKSSSFVYKYLRVVRSGQIYTAYGRNLENSEWDFIGSVKLSGEGQVGVILKGPSLTNSQEMHINSIHIYSSQMVKFLNIKPGEKVRMYNEEGTLLGAQICKEGCSGVNLSFTENAPCKIYFELVSANNEIISTTDVFDAYGGDVYFYGAKLIAFVNGDQLSNDEPYFLGYYENSEIDFDLEIKNPYQVKFSDVVIEAVQFKDEDGYQNVTFSNDEETYESVLTVGTILPESSITLKGKVTRDDTLRGLTTEPFKFYLKISQGKEE